jgi:secretion/DNA translocation related TadE-like protein
VRDDRGSASNIVLALGLVLVAAGFAASSVGTARTGRHQAHSAADLGALAAAGDAVYGRPAACARAAEFVAANRARMSFCTVEGLEVVVGAAVEVHPRPGLTRHARAAARAGPVYAVGED